MKNLIILVITASLVWLMMKFPKEMINPGKLTVVHQELNNKCTACHDMFWGVSSQKCMVCHQLSEIGKDSLGDKNSILFHENLKNQACTNCHSDHKGLHPTSSIENFNHNLLATNQQSNCNSCHNKPTNQLHQPLSNSCNECHTTNSWKSTKAFNHNMIQDSTKNNCVACHKSPTDNFHSSFKNNCTSCHNTDKWRPANFEHSKYFVLDRNHNTTCVTCHANNNFSTYSCFGCHAHTQNNIMGEHREEGIFNLTNCVKCHRSGNEHDIINNINSSNNRMGNNGENNRKGEHGNDDDDD